MLETLAFKLLMASLVEAVFVLSSATLEVKPLISFSLSPTFVVKALTLVDNVLTVESVEAVFEDKVFILDFIVLFSVINLATPAAVEPVFS